jgi:translation initiation factor 2 alpha subunit (eIF-2alpha)
MVYLYKEILPKVDDIVNVKIDKITELGIEVSLNEYNGIMGYISYSEVSRQKKYNINKILKVGQNINLIVIAVDFDKNHIDLSKRTINEEESKMFDLKLRIYMSLYNLWKFIYRRYYNVKTVNNDIFRIFLKKTLWFLQSLDNYKINNELLYADLTNYDKYLLIVDLLSNFPADIPKVPLNNTDTDTDTDTDNDNDINTDTDNDNDINTDTNTDNNTNTDTNNNTDNNINTDNNTNTDTNNNTDNNINTDNNTNTDTNTDTNTSTDNNTTKVDNSVMRTDIKMHEVNLPFNFDKIKVILLEFIEKRIIMQKPTKEIYITLLSFSENALDDIKYVLDYKNYDFFENSIIDFDTNIVYYANSKYKINIEQKDYLLNGSGFNSIDEYEETLINIIKEKSIERNIIFE